MELRVSEGEIFCACPVCRGNIRVRDGPRGALLPAPYCPGCGREFGPVERIPQEPQPTLRVKPDAPRKITCPIRGCAGEVGLRDRKSRGVQKRTWCTTCGTQFDLRVVHCQERFLTVVGGVNIFVKKDDDIHAIE